jgi:DNA replication protein DnaC
MAKRLLKASGLAGAVEKQTFDSFVAETPIQQEMKNKAKEYLETLLSLRWNKETRKPWMYVGGNPGSGKTHICTAVCGELLKNNVPVRYMQWITESRPLKYYVNSDDFDEMIGEYIKPSVLYIDDLFKQKYSDHPTFTDADIKVAFSILNARYLMDKPTIISSEWDLIDNLLDADEGVFSRVYERSKGYTVIVSRDIRNNYRMRYEE